MAFTPTEHPVLVVPSQEKMREFADRGDKGLDELARALEKREELIRLEKNDPYRYGFEPPNWKDADELWEGVGELLIQGGNRAGKSEYAAKRIVQVMTAKKGAKVWVLGMTAQSSIRDQQQLVHKYIPAEWKNIKKGKVQNVSFSQKNGFTENTFILPNGSQCWFMNYSQEMRVIEGGEVDMIWCDELVPITWVETLRFRLVTRAGSHKLSGRLLITFTPVDGYTPTVKEYLNGMDILETRPSPLLPSNVNVGGCPVGRMPYTAKNRKDNGRIIWFFTAMNPYNPYSEMVKTLKGETSIQIKLRAYGYAENLTGNQFPKFCHVHILDADKIPEGTNYLSSDPAWNRNWFILWLRVDEKGRKYIYREWPDRDTFGEWAIPGEKADGAVGPAQSIGGGRGVDEIKELITELENGEEIEERYIDPRAGATQAAGREGGTSIIDLLAEGENPMYFNQAAGISVANGLTIINDWLNYDQSSPVDVMNEPNLYISRDCGNLIYSLQEWTNRDGERGASKDPVDTLRYLAVMEPIHVTAETFAGTGIRGY
tara:strand:+ start:9820 stop:11448 length:1629 start_codon:yes stop_codon:yes gene_type:complete